MNNSEIDINSDEILFYEPHVAAQSLKSVWTRLARTYLKIDLGVYGWKQGAQNRGNF